MGRKVTTLVDRQMDPGYKRVPFKAEDLASGVYIYRLRAGDFVETRRMVKVR